MQLLFKVNTRVMVQPCVHSVLWGTSWNEIKTTGIELERPLVWCSQHIETTEWNASWDCNLCGKSTATLISGTLNLTLGHFLTTMNDYVFLLLRQRPLKFSQKSVHMNTIMWSSMDSGSATPKLQLLIRVKDWL